jgi:Fe-S-cluster-containing dehydrogenase component
MMPNQLRIYPEKCIGCKSCELACALANESELNPSKSRIAALIFVEGRYALPYNLPLTCKQCADALCLKSCPVDAISILRGKTKVVTIDDEQCIGCGRCVDACPYGAMLFDTKGKKAFKCELCGGEPACVAICPTQAVVLTQRKPFYSKAEALQLEGYALLSERNKENFSAVSK